MMNSVLWGNIQNKYLCISLTFVIAGSKYLWEKCCFFTKKIPDVNNKMNKNKEYQIDRKLTMIFVMFYCFILLNLV